VSEDRLNQLQGYLCDVMATHNHGRARGEYVEYRVRLAPANDNAAQESAVSDLMSGADGLVASLVCFEKNGGPEYHICGSFYRSATAAANDNPEIAKRVAVSRARVRANRGPSGKRHPIDNGDGTHSVPLTRGMVAIIDSASAEEIGKHNWCALINPDRRACYAYRIAHQPDGRCKNIRMHRLLLGVADDVQVDHIDCDGLNNRRSNLRPATRCENARNQRMFRNNKSGFKGVCYDKRRHKWRAIIGVAGRKRRHLGQFDTPEAAHAAYVAAAKELYGEFAREG